MGKLNLVISGSGGSATPGGSNGDIQYNNSGVLGGETLVPLAHGGTNADLSASGGATLILAQDASHVISARALIAADIPNLDAAKITTGTLALARGGTNADLSATGGTSFVLRQSSVGAAITASQLAVGEVSGAAPLASPTFTGTVTLPSAVTITGGTLTIAASGGGTVTLQSNDQCSIQIINRDSSNGNTSLILSAGLAGLNGGSAGVFLSDRGLGGGISFTGAITATSSIAATGALSGSSLAVTGAITGASAALTGAITGASAALTGAVSLTNSTAATLATAQSSPILTLAGRYWNGASAADTWTFQDVLTNGLNGASTLALVHSGTSGAATLQTPSIIQIGSGNLTLTGTTQTVTIQPTLSGSLTGQLILLSTTSGATSGGITFNAVNTGAAQILLTRNSSSTLQQITLAGGMGTATGSLIILGGRGVNNANVDLTAISGEQGALKIGLGGATGIGDVIFSPTSGTATFVGLNVNPAVNQAITSDTIIGVALVANVAAIVFSTANTLTVGATITVTAGTNTALNGSQTVVAAASRASSPYTITNSVENSSSVVTLTIGTHNIVANDWVFLSGLTTATWLNNQVVKVTSVVANTSITFTDLSAHGAKVTGVDTGTVTCNYVTYALTHANITGINDTGTVTQQASGAYTAIRASVVETALGGTGNLLLDLQAGAAGSTSKFAVNNSGVITKYNGATTVSGGTPSEIATVDLTAQSAAIAATNLTASAPQSGMYRISWSATITTAATTSSVLGGTNGLQTGYTSPTDSVAKTTVVGNSVTSAGNTTGTAIGGCEVIYAKTGTAITYAFDYTSVGVTAMVYELHVKLEAL